MKPIFQWSAAVGSLLMTHACATGVELTGVVPATNGSSAGNAGVNGRTNDSGGSDALGGRAGRDEVGGANTGGRDSSRGGRNSLGGAVSAEGGQGVGGAVATGGEQATGGRATGGARATGGRATGGARATGGTKAGGGSGVGGSGVGGSGVGGSGVGGSGVGGSGVGGAQTAGGVATAGRASGIGGGKATGGCDFSSTACGSDVCSSVPTWETTACSGLLTCLETNYTCITAADPLCSTKGAYGNPTCTQLYNIGTPASRTSLSAYVACLCGL